MGLKMFVFGLLMYAIFLQKAQRGHQQQAADVSGEVPPQTETALQRPPPPQEQVLHHVTRGSPRTEPAGRFGQRAVDGPPVNFDSELWI